MRVPVVVIAIFFCSCTEAPDASIPQTQPSKMKTIDYRGGLVRFRIPDQWIEEYADVGGGTFYADNSDSPTLRLNVLTFESPRAVDENTPSELLSSRAEKTGQSIERLDTGNAVIAYNQRSQEDGHALLVFYWELANAVPPAHCRLAVFSLTILESQQHDPDIVKTIQMVDGEVKSSEFATELGL